MKNYIFTVLFATLVIFNFACVKNQEQSGIPKSRTILNLDKDIEILKIPVKVIFNNQKTGNTLGKDSDAHFIGPELVEGPDSTFYTLGDPNDRLVQYSQDGKFIKNIDIPGKWKQPYGLFNVFNKYLYIPDYDGLKVFDLNGNYVRTVSPPFIISREFSVGKNGLIFAHPFKKEPYMTCVYDSVGKEIKKIGPIKKDSNDILQNDMRSSMYYIITNEYSDFVWCVYKSFPIIKKYDLNGNLIEEIKFEGNLIDSLDKENKKLGNMASNQQGRNDSIKQCTVTIIVPLFINPKVLKNGDLILNIPDYDAIQISGNENPSRIIRKYNFTGIPDYIEHPKDLSLTIMHGKIYGYNHRTIVKEDR
jgi:hypothetical protein